MTEKCLELLSFGRVPLPLQNMGLGRWVLIRMAVMLWGSSAGMSPPRGKFCRGRACTPSGPFAFRCSQTVRPSNC